MIQFIIDNLGTILVGAAVAGVLAAILIKIIRDKRKGKCIGCDGGCAGCPSQSDCDI